MKIITIGGGTGQFTLLSALRELADIDITAIVSMVDSGGSTGKLRDEYGVLPPGDILKCLIALSPYKEAREILQSRFSVHDRLRGHNAGNLLLTFLTQYLSNNFVEATKALGEILAVKGKVLPVTTDKATLVAELEDGRHVYSESAIDVGREKRGKIRKTFLVPHTGHLEVSAEALAEIAAADFIIIGPGDLYTSVIPNFLVPGVREAIEKSAAKLIYIANIMTKFGETHGFTVRSFVDEVERHLGKRVDALVANSRIPDDETLHKYSVEGAEPVRFDMADALAEREIVLADLISDGDLARHDVFKLQKVLGGVIGIEQVK